MSNLLPPFPYGEIRDAFADELKRASKGEKTSLPFIHNPLPHDPLMQGGNFQAIVIGGTHYESHLAELMPDGTIIHLTTVHEGLLPPLNNEEIFLQSVCEHLVPSVKYVSLNLAYPLIPVVRNGALDGKLAFATKEHALTGLVGKTIGKTIEEYVEKTEGRKIQVVLANDSICLVLAGLQLDDIRRDNVCGVIVGSGYNMGFFLDDNTIINIESSNFNRFTQSPTGKMIDGASANPGKGIFEKESSGLYLYQHYNILKKDHGIESRNLRDSGELSDLASAGTGIESELARALMQRSAALVASQITGLSLFKGSPDELHIITEGSVFKKGWHYEDMVKEGLQKLIKNPDSIHFHHIRNSSLGGAVSLVTICRI